MQAVSRLHVNGLGAILTHLHITHYPHEASDDGERDNGAREQFFSG